MRKRFERVDVDWNKGSAHDAEEKAEVGATVAASAAAGGNRGSARKLAANPLPPSLFPGVAGGAGEVVGGVRVRSLY